MLRKYAGLLVAISLVMMVIAACIVRTPARRAQPVYYEQGRPVKHKPVKHKKHKHKHKKHHH